MAAFSDSGPVFKTRCAQVGLAPEDVEKLEKVGVNSLAKVAFMTSYTPGSGDDKDLISAFEASLGTPPNVRGRRVLSDACSTRPMLLLPAKCACWWKGLMKVCLAN